MRGNLEEQSNFSDAGDRRLKDHEQLNRVGKRLILAIFGHNWAHLLTFLSKFTYQNIKFYQKNYNIIILNFPYNYIFWTSKLYLLYPESTISDCGILL